MIFIADYELLCDQECPFDRDSSVNLAWETVYMVSPLPMVDCSLSL